MLSTHHLYLFDRRGVPSQVSPDHSLSQGSAPAPLVTDTFENPKRPGEEHFIFIHEDVTDHLHTSGAGQGVHSFFVSYTSETYD